MQLGFDITSLLYARGVSRYTSNLLRALAKQPGITLNLYGSSFRRKAELQALIKNLKIPTANVSLQSYPIRVLSKLWSAGLNPVKPRLPKIDIFHAWDWHFPPDQDVPLVTTIHDLAMLRLPKIAHPTILKRHQAAWEKLQNNQAHIIAVSQTTKKDIVELLGIPPKRVHVVYEALPQEVVVVGNTLTDESTTHELHHLGITKPFFLFVGTTEPRKNLKRLIQAWQPFSQEYELVVAGSTGWDESLENLEGTQPIVLGPVSDQTLATLYSRARMFLFPSLYEGFGLPILEAFHFGTPVLTSNNSGMAEVAGNAAMLVDPLEVESIQNGITELLNENTAAEKLRDQRMVLRLQLFGWEQAAQQSVAVYQDTIRDWQS